MWLAGSRAQAQYLWRTGLAALWHVGSSQTRDRTHIPCTDRQILNHYTTREVPCLFSFAFTICFGALFLIFFFLPFLLGCEAGRVLVLRPGVGPEPARWESQVQDTGPPEASQPHVILIGESSPRDLCLNTKTQLQCWMPHTKQLARQEHNPTH